MNSVPARVRTIFQSYVLGDDPENESLDAHVVQMVHPLACLETCK